MKITIISVIVMTVYRHNHNHHHHHHHHCHRPPGLLLSPIITSIEWIVRAISQSSRSGRKRPLSMLWHLLEVMMGLNNRLGLKTMMMMMMMYRVSFLISLLSSLHHILKDVQSMRKCYKESNEKVGSISTANLSVSPLRDHLKVYVIPIDYYYYYYY